MKERNKGVEVEASSYTNQMDYYYSTSDQLFPCNKHPSSTSGGGICPYCLKDRLVKLVCSDCGEQRLSSCSCSDDHEITSSNRNSNSCSTVEVGSVGRVSFLIENEKNESNNNNNIFQHLNSKSSSKLEEKEDVFVLRRSNSNCVEIKKNGSFWRIGKLFKKKKINKEIKECGKSVGGFDDEIKSNEMWMGVSRSRSLCSFRGGVFGSEDGGESVILSGARSSISAARSSGVNGSSMILESGRRSGYSEAEPRRSNFDGGGGGERKDFLFENENIERKSVDSVMNKRVFSLRESDFKGMDESRFIDFKLDYSSSSESKNHHHQHQQQQQEFSSFRIGNFMGHDHGFDGGGGGSCRITLNDRGVKRGKKSIKGWKWIFRYHSNWGNGKKRDQNLIFKT